MSKPIVFRKYNPCNLELVALGQKIPKGKVKYKGCRLNKQILSMIKNGEPLGKARYFKTKKI